MKLVSKKAILRKKVLFVEPRKRIISSRFKTELKSAYCDCDWHLNLKKKLITFKFNCLSKIAYQMHQN